MIDNLSLLLTHSLMLLAAWRFMKLARRDPDEVHQSAKPQGNWGKGRQS